MIDLRSDAVTGHNGPTNAGEEFGELLPHSLRQTLTAQEDQLRELIRSHPLATVFGALALGFVVARWMREA